MTETKDPYEFIIKKDKWTLGPFKIGKNVFYDKTSKKFLFFNPDSMINLNFENTNNPPTIPGVDIIVYGKKEPITKSDLFNTFNKFKNLTPKEQIDNNNNDYKFKISINSGTQIDYTIGQTAFYDERTKHVLCFKSPITFTLKATELKKRKSDILPTDTKTKPEDILAILNALAEAQKEPTPVGVPKGGQSNQTKARRRFHRKKYTKRNHIILPKSLIYSGIVEFSAISSSRHRRPRSRKLRDKNV